MSDLLVCFFTGCIYYYFFRSIHSLIKWFHTLNTDYIQIWPSVAPLDNCGVNKLIRGEINLSMEQHVYFSTVFLFLNVEKTSLHISPLQDFIRNRNPSFDRSGGNCMMQKRSCAVGLNGLSCLRSQYVDRSGRRTSYILIPPTDDNVKAAFCQQDFHSVRINLKLCLICLVWIQSVWTLNLIIKTGMWSVTRKQLFFFCPIYLMAFWLCMLLICSFFSVDFWVTSPMKKKNRNAAQRSLKRNI